MVARSDDGSAAVQGSWRRYRKRPVVIEARGPIAEEEVIETLEGRLHASAGDYIIRGVQGELYPCKPDIFDATYEPVSVEEPW